MPLVNGSLLIFLLIWAGGAGFSFRAPGVRPLFVNLRLHSLHPLGTSSHMAKKKDAEDELFDRLHDGGRIRDLHKQARKEKRIERRKQWWEKNGPR